MPELALFHVYVYLSIGLVCSAIAYYIAFGFGPPEDCRWLGFVLIIVGYPGVILWLVKKYLMWTWKKLPGS